MFSWHTYGITGYNLGNVTTSFRMSFLFIKFLFFLYAPVFMFKHFIRMLKGDCTKF